MFTAVFVASSVFLGATRCCAGQYWVLGTGYHTIPIIYFEVHTYQYLMIRGIILINTLYSAVCGWTFGKRSIYILLSFLVLSDHIPGTLLVPRSFYVFPRIFTSSDQNTSATDILVLRCFVPGGECYFTCSVIAWCIIVIQLFFWMENCQNIF